MSSFGTSDSDLTSGTSFGTSSSTSTNNLYGTLPTTGTCEWDFHMSPVINQERNFIEDLEPGFNEYGSHYVIVDNPVPFVSFKVNPYECEETNDDYEAMVDYNNSNADYRNTYRWEVVMWEPFYDQIASLSICSDYFHGNYPLAMKYLYVTGTKKGFKIPDCERLSISEYENTDDFILGKVKHMYMACTSGTLRLPEGIVEFHAPNFNGTLKNIPDSLKILTLSTYSKELPLLNNVETLRLNSSGIKKFTFNPNMKEVTMTKFNGKVSGKVNKKCTINMPLFKKKLREQIRQIKLDRMIEKLKKLDI